MKKVIFGLMASVLFSTSAFAGEVIINKINCGDYADSVMTLVAEHCESATDTQLSTIWSNAYANCLGYEIDTPKDKTEEITE